MPKKRSELLLTILRKIAEDGKASGSNIKNRLIAVDAMAQIYNVPLSVKIGNAEESPESEGTSPVRQETSIDKAVAAINKQAVREI
jgi:hypothetical protein